MLTSYNFTYHKDDFSCFSSPDHILTYSNFSNLIDSVFTLDPVENFSDHLPLYLSLKLPDFLCFPCPRISSVSSHCHPNQSHAQSSSSVNWFKVNQHHIVITFLPAFLNFLMTSLIVVTLTALFTMLILTATVSNFLTVLSPLQSFASPHRVTVYDMLLSLVGIDLHIPLSNLLSFGTNCGCPTSGVQFLTKNSKRRFKYEVHQLRHCQNYIQCENLATAISYSNPQEFWKQVEKLSKPSSGAMSSSSIIDGCNNDIEISNIIASKLESLLNSVPDTTSRTNLQN